MSTTRTRRSVSRQPRMPRFSRVALASISGSNGLSGCDEIIASLTAEAVRDYLLIRPIVVSEVPARDDGSESTYEVVAGNASYALARARLTPASKVPVLLVASSGDNRRELLDALIAPLLERVDSADMARRWATFVGVGDSAILQNPPTHSMAARLLGMSTSGYHAARKR